MSRKRLVTHCCIVCGTSDWNVVKHLFPTCPERRAKWLEILKIDSSTFKKSAKVCERHFAKDQYVRTCLKSNAIPKSPTEECERAFVSERSKTTRHPKERKITIKNALEDKIDLNGRCVFCLEMLPQCGSSQAARSAQWTTLAHLWPYLQINGPPTRFFPNSTQDFFTKKRGDGELSFSQIPPMCSSCLPNVDILNTLHQELVEIRAQLVEKETLLNATACKLREVIAKSAKSRRSDFQKELTASNLPISCIVNTTKFLDSLLDNPASLRSLSIVPKPTAVQNPKLIVVGPIPGNYNLVTECPIKSSTYNDLSGVGVVSPSSTTAKVNSNIPNVYAGGTDLTTNVKMEVSEETDVISHLNSQFRKRSFDSDSKSDQIAKNKGAPVIINDSDSSRPNSHPYVTDSLSDEEELMDVQYFRHANCETRKEMKENTGANDPLADPR